MLVTISGLSGSGKSSGAKGLSERLGIPTVDVGSIFRAMAKRHRMDVIAFGLYAEKHPEIDRELDDEMIRLAKKRKNLILQGRLAGLMSAARGLKAHRIWIDASLDTRAKRTAVREGIPLAKARKNVAKRDNDNRNRYLETYGLDLNDRSVYDTVVQTDDLTIEEVVSFLAKNLTNVWPKRRKQLKPRTKPSSLLSSRKTPPPPKSRSRSSK